MTKIISKELLDILVCPECKQELLLSGNNERGWFLACKACRLDYPIRDGIPVMLKDQALKTS